MPAATFKLNTLLGDTVSQIRDVAKLARDAGGGTDRMDAAFKKLEATTAGLSAKVAELEEKLRKKARGDDAADESTKKLERSVKLLTHAQTQALQAGKLTEESQKKLIRVGDQWFRVTADQVDGMKLLASAYNTALKPSEKTALMLKRLEQEALHATTGVDKYAEAIAKLNIKLADQQKREAANRGRSLSMLFDEQNLVNLTASGVLFDKITTMISEKLAELADKGNSVVSKFVEIGADGELSLTKLGKGSALALTGIGALAVGAYAAGKAIYSVVNSSYEAIDSIADLSARVGVSAEYLSQYRVAALQTDVSIEEIATSIKFLQKSMFEAQDPTSEQSKLFKALGFDVQSAAFKAGDAQTIFSSLIGRLGSLASESDKVAISTKLLGKSGNELKPLFDLGTTGLQQMIDKSKELGLTLGGDSLRAAGDYEAATKTLSLALTGLKESSVVLLPWLTSIVDKMTEILNFGALPLEKQIRAVQREIKALGSVEFGTPAQVKRLSDLNAQLEDLYRHRTRATNAAAAETAQRAIDAKIMDAQLQLLKEEAERKKRLTEQTKAAAEAERELEDRVRKHYDAVQSDGQRAMEDLGFQLVKIGTLEQENFMHAQKWLQAIKDKRDDLLKPLPAMTELPGSSDGFKERVQGFVDIAKKFKLDEIFGGTAILKWSKSLAEAFPLFEKIGGVASGIGKGIFSLVDGVIKKATGSGLMDLLTGGPGAGKKLAEGLAAVDWGGMLRDIAVNLIQVITTLAADPGIWSSLAKGAADALILLAKNADGLIALVLGIFDAIVDNIDVLIPAVIDLGIQLAIGIIKKLPEITIALVKGVAVALYSVLIGIVAGILRALGLDAAADKVEGVGRGTTPAASTAGAGVGTGGSATSATGGNSINVTDAFVPASNRAKTVRVLPGDDVYAAQRGGPGDLAQLMRDGNMGVREQNALLTEQNQTLAAILTALTSPSGRVLPGRDSNTRRLA